MRTKKNCPIRFSNSKAGFVVIFMLNALILFCFQGCNPEDDDFQPSDPTGSPPSITFSLVKGGKVANQTENEASITVFRKSQLEVSYQIDIPNGLLDATINDVQVKYEMNLGTNGKSAIYSYLPWEIHTDIPHTLVIMDKKQLSTSFTFQPVYELGLNPEDIIAGSWQKIQFDGYPEGGSIGQVIGTADKSFLAIIDGSIYKGTQNGRTWRNVFVDGDYWISSVILHPSGDLYAIGMVGWGPFYGVMYKSTDHGNTWSQLKTNFPTVEGPYGPMEISKEGTIQFYVSDATGQQSGIWRSQDGEKWSLPSDFFNDPFGSYLVSSLAVINDSTTLAIANTSDGWESSSKLVRSFDYGKTWQTKILPDQQFNNLFYASNGNIYVYSQYSSGIFVSKNLGETWHKITADLPESAPPINSIAEGTDGIIYIAPQDYGVFKLEGDRWKSVGTDLATYNALNFFIVGESFHTIVQPSTFYRLE